MLKIRYQITEDLLQKIKQIAIVLTEMKSYKLSEVVLFELQEEARSLSSYSSTSIEGNPLPLTEVKKILKKKPENIRDTEREVLQYNEALMAVHSLIQNQDFEFNIENIVKTHKTIMQGLLPKIKLNKLRKESVVVNDPLKRKTIFYPPDYKDVPKLLNELLEFCNAREDIDPLIMGAIFHKQFVLIHPFIDGNGRTVRILTKAFLASKGIDTFSLFSFENYYNKNVAKYFSFVGEKGDFYDLHQKLDFTKWIVYFCDGILDELLRVKKLIEEKQGPTVSSIKERVTEEQKKILEFLKLNGIITDSDYQKLTSRAKSTRNLDFNKLQELGLIKREGVGKATYYKLKKS